VLRRGRWPRFAEQQGAEALAGVLRVNEQLVRLVGLLAAALALLLGVALACLLSLVRAGR
jgi:hypothetical protein